MARRLVSVAVDAFAGDFADEPLKFATDLRTGLVEIMRRVHGYEVMPGCDRADLTGEDIGIVVRDAIKAIQQDPDPASVLVVHVISHGLVPEDQVYVVGSDGRCDAMLTNVSSWLTYARQSGDAGPGVLFLIDTCGAGNAALQPWQVMAHPDRPVRLIAACEPWRPAFGGRLTRAATAVLHDLTVADAAFDDEHVPFSALALAIGREVDSLSAGGYPQRAVTIPANQAREPGPAAPFFTNPNHGRSIAGMTPQVLREFVRNVHPSVDPWHFLTRGAGTAPEPGRPVAISHFHGRGSQLSALKPWLPGPAKAGDNLRVVTGSPGVGKSALLGLVVCRCHPRLFKPTAPLWSRHSGVLPESALTNLVAVHAREQDAASVVRSIAAQLNLNLPADRQPVEALAQALTMVEPQPVLIVDALDETADMVQVGRDLLTLVAPRRVDGTAGCRILVGTRSGVNWPAASELLAAADEQARAPYPGGRAYR